ncbi:hypothetical protein GCM10022205_25150 [Spinactinospora alkalitolerans]
MASLSGPAWATTAPPGLQTPERPAVLENPPPVAPAKLAIATHTR